MAHDTSTGSRFLTKEKEGDLTVLKCRTPGEAALVVAELEAANVPVVFPDEEEIEKEFQSTGFVNIRVSTQSYEAAKELRTIVEAKHWDNRADEPLSIAMMVVSVGLGLMPIPGFVFLFMIHGGYTKKGYKRKARSFPIGFFMGFGLVLALLSVFLK